MHVRLLWERLEKGGWEMDIKCSQLNILLFEILTKTLKVFHCSMLFLFLTKGFDVNVAIDNIRWGMCLFAPSCELNCLIQISRII